MASEDTAAKGGAASALSAVELLSIIGFALATGWMLLTFYWLFCEFPEDVPTAARDFAQLWVFVGAAVGYLLLHFAGRNPKFNLFGTKYSVLRLVCGLPLLVAAFAMQWGAYIPSWGVCSLNFLAGTANPLLVTAWVDILNRVGTRRFGRFTGAAFSLGALLTTPCLVIPGLYLPCLAAVYLVASVALLRFSTRYARGNETRAPLESTNGKWWRFVKEHEPAIFMFDVVFAFSFVFLFNHGSQAIIFGLVAIIPSTLLLAVFSHLGVKIDIWIMQRLITVLCVLACIIVPFASLPVQVAVSAVMVAAWAFFTCANYAFLARKNQDLNDMPFFRRGPIRLFVGALGFACGWGVSTALAYSVGISNGDFAYTVARLIAVIILVCVVMLFFPSSKSDRSEPVEGEPSAEQHTQTQVSVEVSESELFEMRCAAIAKLYGLSPRETEVLGLLAHGRNAAYIQEKLVISPHTVKSHIYNVYRKLDIHSQQKLMDFVEQFDEI